MAVHRLNHAVLWVRDADRSKDFYVDALGFRVVFGSPGRSYFMQAAGSTNDHDLAVMAVGPDADGSSAGSASVGMYHLAWEVDTLGDLRDTAKRLTEMGALVGASDHGTTKSLYAKDPDGLEFEVTWVIPLDSLTEADLEARGRGVSPLDLDREIERFGDGLTGGVGISRPPVSISRP